MKIREAALDDAQGITGLVGELGYEGDESAMIQRLGSLLGSGVDAMLVAEDAGRVVGWVQVHVSTTLEAGSRAEIAGLVVGAQYRRLGWGGRLVAAAEDWARARGMARVVVRSNVQRVASHEFYPALGYAKSKVQAVYWKSLAP